MAIFYNHLFMPWTPPRGTTHDLLWWQRILSAPMKRAIPEPKEYVDIHAYSNVSSSTSIGIIIGEEWWAWHLKPGWRRPEKDIGWVEAARFLLLVATITKLRNNKRLIKVYSDNKAVIEE